MATKRAEHVEPERFPSTHWSLVAAAGEGEQDARRAALQKLLMQYLPPLRTHLILSKRLNDAEADDLLQAFVADKILDSDFVQKADAARGKFRTFLLTALGHYMISDIRRRRAKKRSPAEGMVDLDDAPWAQPATEEQPDQFELEWARRVLALAVERMQRECREGGRNDLWLLFESRILKPILDHTPPPPYDELAGRFGFATPTQACNALKTCKRIFERSLNAVIGEYAGAGEQIQAELLDLKEIIGRMRG